MSQPYLPAFFAAPPEVVLPLLAGAALIRYGPSHPFQGLLLAADALDEVDADQELYRAPPGTLVRYATPDGFTLGISCHPPEGGGVISVLSVLSQGDILSAAGAYHALGGDLLHGLLIGRQSGFYLSSGPVDLAEAGYEQETTPPVDSPPNRHGWLCLRHRKL